MVFFVVILTNFVSCSEREANGTMQGRSRNGQPPPPGFLNGTAGPGLPPGGLFNATFNRTSGR